MNKCALCELIVYAYNLNLYLITLEIYNIIFIIYIKSIHTSYLTLWQDQITFCPPAPKHCIYEYMLQIG